MISYMQYISHEQTLQDCPKSGGPRKIKKGAIFVLTFPFSILYLYFSTFCFYFTILSTSPPFSHSLLASKLLAKVAEKFRVELSVTNLFIHSTVSAMARLLDSMLSQNGSRDAVVAEPTLDLAKEVEMHDQNVLR